MPSGDIIGKRGEAAVVTALMDYRGRRGPYFDPHFLGEKCPTFDYLVELLGVGRMPAYFLAQVKTTRRGYVASVHRRPKTGLSSLPTTHPLDRPTLRALWLEVRDHWRAVRAATPRTSAFGL